MARNVQLGQMLSMLRAEVGDAQSVALGVNVAETYKITLRRVQETLWYDVEWPFLQIYLTDPLPAGTRFQQYPAGIDFERTVHIWSQQSGMWRELDYGITPEHMNIYDSDAGQQASPAVAWQHRPENNGYEIWPIPNQNTSLRFKGTAALKPLVADADTCTLDAQLVVLFAATEILSARNRKDGEAKLAVAQSLMRRLKGLQGAKKRAPFVMGGGATPYYQPRPGIDYIPSVG
jgi:hypothetical protein